jgi:general secretion pathway protein D
VQRILEIVKLLDVQGQQPQVSIVPVRYADAKDVAQKIQTILGGSGTGARSGSKKYFSYKILTDERSNSVVLFGPPRTISDVKDLVKRFDIKVEDASRQATIHVRPLDYADAKKLAATLSSLTGSSSSSRTTRRRASSRTTTPQVATLGEGVKITADESSNSLLITGSRSDYQAVNAIIRKLDVRKSQVYIETDILDITLDGNFNFGLSTLVGHAPAGGTGLYDALPISWQGNQGIGGILTASAAAANGGGTAAAATAAAAGLQNSLLSSDLVVGLLKNIDLNIAGLGQITTGVLVNMLKTDGNTKTLSTPNILTANNQQANIVVGETRYFPVTSTNAQAGLAETKFEKVDANLTLTVTPSISHSNYITLDIDLDAESLGVGPEGVIPPINRRKSKQIITVKNKQTVVIGGLEQDNEREVYTKVPLLGDIPIIGNLFRSTEKSKRKTQLMMFMTPYIIHGANDLADIYATKRRQMDEFLFRSFGSKFRKSRFYKRIPTYADGRYLQTEADLYEQQTRKKMKDTMYNDSSNANSRACW